MNKKCFNNQHLSRIIDVRESCRSIFGKFPFNTKIGLISSGLHKFSSHNAKLCCIHVNSLEVNRNHLISKLVLFKLQKMGQKHALPQSITDHDFMMDLL